MSLIIFDRRQRQSFIKIDDAARRTLLVNKHRQWRTQRHYISRKCDM